MNGGTDAALMLEALRRFLREELQPELAGYKAYSTRVAANMLGILEREQQLAPGLAQLDAEHVAAGGSAGRELARALRDGDADLDGKLLQYLRQRALRQMAIDNPRYPGYRQALVRWGNPKQDGDDA